MKPSRTKEERKMSDEEIWQFFRLKLELGELTMAVNAPNWQDGLKILKDDDPVWCREDVLWLGEIRKRPGARLFGTVFKP